MDIPFVPDCHFSACAEMIIIWSLRGRDGLGEFVAFTGSVWICWLGTPTCCQDSVSVCVLLGLKFCCVSCFVRVLLSVRFINYDDKLSDSLSNVTE